MRPVCAPMPARPRCGGPGLRCLRDRSSRRLLRTEFMAAGPVASVTSLPLQLRNVGYTKENYTKKNRTVSICTYGTVCCWRVLPLS